MIVEETVPEPSDAAPAPAWSSMDAGGEIGPSSLARGPAGDPVRAAAASATAPGVAPVLGGAHGFDLGALPIPVRPEGTSRRKKRERQDRLLLAVGLTCIRLALAALAVI